MSRKRYYLLDILRGFTLLHMIAYHAIWDLVNLNGMDWKWFHTLPGDIWQKYISWSFILLSGFCFSLGKNTLKRGISLILCSTVISAVTLIFMPDDRILFGVLTLIGSCTLLMLPAQKILKKCMAPAGLTVCFLLFLLTQNINQGFLGFAEWNFIKLPETWYVNMFTTYLGFTTPDFYSSDYFSLFPWLFLFLTGYFLYRIFEENHLLVFLQRMRNRPLEWLGRHSLLLYLIHQPVIYLILRLFVPAH